MFGRKKRDLNYNKEIQKPMVRASICTGEKVAGFRDRTTGKFTDVMLIRSEKDLAEFCKEYEVDKKEIGQLW